MNYQTKRLDPNNEQDFTTALTLLKEGEVVALPTETVYGLAADARNIQAVEKIFSAKNRPADHPLIVHIASFAKVQEWAKDIPSSAEKLAQAFWPGPLTLLLPKAPWVNVTVTGGLETIALRVPRHPVFLRVLESLDTGLAAPSANPHKRISPTTADHVLAGLAGKIPAVLDGGPCTFGLESTILDLTREIPTILRPGPITKAMLENVLNGPVQEYTPHTEKVAGNMLIHYQPVTKTIAFSKDEIEQYLALPEQEKKKVGVMAYSPIHSTHPRYTLIPMPSTKDAYAQQLYNVLHQLDAADLDEILIELPPHDAQWNDVRDRIMKATHK